jgi:OST-HTH/LOTUS domain
MALGTKQAPEITISPLVEKTFPKDFLMEALEKSIDDSGWSQLGTFGSYLQKIQPDFDSRLHGYKKLSDLVRARSDLFETEERETIDATNKVLYLRAKRIV